MTCIVGLKHKGVVYLGGDSASVAGDSISARVDKKVFSNGDFVMGFMGSFRIGQLLRWAFKPPKRGRRKTMPEYLVTSFVDSLRKCYEEHGALKSSKSGYDMGDHFLLGIDGKMFHIESDFQVAETFDNYNAIGCGRDVALGALYATEGVEDPEYRIKTALEAAAKHVTGVAPPFVIIDSQQLEARAL